MQGFTVIKNQTMKKYFLYLLALSGGESFAQPAIQWQRSLGGNGNESISSIRQTNDGGYIIAASATSYNNGDVNGVHVGLLGPTQPDFWIVKLDHNQQIQWQRSLGSSLREDIREILLTVDGGYLVAGSTLAITSTQDVVGNHGGSDGWIVKLDNAGNIQWQKCLGGSLNEHIWAVESTIDGGFIAAGSATSVDGDVSGNHGAMDYWIVKLDLTGNIQWQKSLGGTKDDAARSVKQTEDGGYILAGYSYSSDGDVIRSKGKRNGKDADYWVVKLDPAGIIQWQKGIGGTKDETAHSIVQTVNGYVVAGFSNSNDGEVSGHHGNSGNKPNGDPTADCWIVKLSNSGNIIWQRSLGGDGNDIALAVIAAPDGSCTVVGHSNSSNGDVTNNHGGIDYWVARFNSNGIIEWQKSLGGSLDDQGTCIQQTTDGGLILGGGSRSNDGDVSGNHGNSDAWLVKLSPFSARVIKKQPDETADIWGLQVYPNPAVGHINFQIAVQEFYGALSICIFDALGNKRRQMRLASPVETFHLNEFIRGTYFYRVTRNNKPLYTGTFIIK